MDTPRGIPAREAVDAKRGFLYQDYATALSWMALQEDEVIFIEVAEDYLTATKRGYIATQVRDTESTSLTLNSQYARDALDQFVELTERNSDKAIHYVYLTTSAVAREHKVEHRGPSGEPGIEYWRKVQSGADIEPLRTSLLAMDLSTRFRAFVEARSGQELYADLIARVDWLTGSDPIDVLNGKLKTAVASLAFAKYKVPFTKGRTFADNILAKVQETAIEPDRSRRRLSYVDLHELLQHLAFRPVGLEEFETLHAKAALAERLPVEVLNKDIDSRLSTLRLSRYFVGFDKATFAKALANDVRYGATHAAAGTDARALAMVWCARVLLDDAPDLAVELIGEAGMLCDSKDLAYVEALSMSASQPQAAMERLLGIDTPEAATARYIIQRRAGTPATALTWLQEAGLLIDQLDADGRFLVIEDMINADRWPEAIAAAAGDSWDRSGRQPALILTQAICELASAVPEERRFEIASHPPLFDAMEFPLSANEEGLGYRRKALARFNELTRIADQLGLERVKSHSVEYSLWLSLTDPSSYLEARNKLSILIGDAESRDRLLPLAISCKLPVDLGAIARDLDQRLIRDGALSFDGARSRLAMLIAGAAADWLPEWPRYSKGFEKYFESDFLNSIYIQGLMHAGHFGEARSVLEKIGPGPMLEGLSRRLALMEAETKGEDKVALRRAAFEASQSTADLELLNEALAEARSWTELTHAAGDLYAQSKTLANAEKYVYALEKARRWSDLTRFLDDNPALVSQSRLLAEVAAQTMLLRSRWSELRSEVSSGHLATELASKLQFHGILLSLQWEDFGSLIDAALSCTPEGRTAEDFISLASVAATLGRRNDSKKLTHAAAKRAPEDPAILMAAYMQAVRGMWDSEPEVNKWLPQAVRTSGEDGPVRQASFAELLELAPRMTERAERAWLALASGSSWLWIYASQMNSRLSDVTTALALANRVEHDPRRRSIIPAFSGHRSTAPIESFESVAVDPVALLTLARLGLLDGLLELFGKVFIPYSTGAWLFDELQHVGFHQPRLIEDAQTLIGLVARRWIGVVPGGLGVDAKLVGEVGEELAELMTQASELASSGKKAYVIRSSPILRFNDVMHVEVGVADQQDVLRSCLCVVSTLAQRADISASDRQRFEAYLSRQDAGWTFDAEIPAGATLLLDDLSVQYFQHLSLLTILKDAGFSLLIHHSTEKQALALSGLRETSTAVEQELMRLREFLTAGIREGRIEVLPAPSESWHERPSKPLLAAELFEGVAPFGSALIDERALNQHQFFEHEDQGRIAVHTTIDLLDALRATGRVSQRQWLDHRCELRRSGYALIPFDTDELLAALGTCEVRGGRLLETVELRAIRENVALIQIREVLQLPNEHAWLSSLMTAVVEAIKQLWSGSDEVDRVRAMSRWLLNLVTIESFGKAMPGEMSFERLSLFQSLMPVRLLIDAVDNRIEEFGSWLDDDVFGPMRLFSPAAFAVTLGAIRTMLVDLKGHLTGRSGADDRIGRQVLVQTFNELPEVVRQELLDDRDFLKGLGLSPTIRTKVSLPDEPHFDRDEVFQAGADAAEQKVAGQVLDGAGNPWLLEPDDRGRVFLTRSGFPRIEIPDIRYLSQDAQVRLAHLAERASEMNVELLELEPWQAVVRKGPLATEQVDRLNSFLDDFPAAVHERIGSELARQSASHGTLLIRSADYFMRLVGAWNGDRDLATFAQRRSQEQLRLLETESVDAYALIMRLLLSSIHSTTAPKAIIAAADSVAVARIVDQVAQLDLWSTVGLIEGLLGRADAFTDSGPAITASIRAFHGAIADSTRLELTVALCKYSDCYLHRSGLLQDVPPFWRKLASFAHAGAIERAALRGGVDLKSFESWVRQSELTFVGEALSDMSYEPRWAPYLLNPRQLAQELLGRVVAACEVHVEVLRELGIESLLEGGDGQISGLSLKEMRQAVAAQMPGPLEGALSAPDLPEELQGAFLEHLDGSDPVASWMYIATLGALWKLPANVVHRITTEMEETGRFVLGKIPEDTVLEVLARSACMAAGLREAKLAAAITTVSRMLARVDNGNLTPANSFFVAAMAAAATDRRDEWMNLIVSAAEFCVANCTDRDDVEAAYTVISALASVDWRLRQPLARSLVALEAAALRKAA